MGRGLRYHADGPLLLRVQVTVGHESQQGKMCPTCEGFAERIRVNTRYEYVALLKQFKDIIQEGTMTLLKGPQIDDVLTGQSWDDNIEQIFQGTSCHHRFPRAIETYHGSGGSWEAFDFTK